MIFYFSGTGNTRWVATQIAQHLDEELLNIPDLIRASQYSFSLKEGERIGFCFPTHGWQPPRIVREFIRQLSVGLQAANASDHFCWALTTCGDNTGEAMTILNKELAPKGLHASTVFSVIMPESYVCLPFMHTDPPEKESQKKSNAKTQLQEIVSIVKDRRQGIEQLEKGATPRLYSYVIGGYFNKKMITDRKFTVDEEACIGCGKCREVCPVDNIRQASTDAGSRKQTPPEWLHNGQCTCCLACYHHCPTHAINYGKITRKREQYYFR